MLLEIKDQLTKEQRAKAVRLMEHFKDERGGGMRGPHGGNGPRGRRGGMRSRGQQGMGAQQGMRNRREPKGL